MAELLWRLGAPWADLTDRVQASKDGATVVTVEGHVYRLHLDDQWATWAPSTSATDAQGAQWTLRDLTLLTSCQLSFSGLDDRDEPAWVTTMPPQAVYLDVEAVLGHADHERIDMDSTGVYSLVGSGHPHGRCFGARWCPDRLFDGRRVTPWWQSHLPTPTNLRARWESR